MSDPVGLLIELLRKVKVRKAATKYVHALADADTTCYAFDISMFTNSTHDRNT